jgi:hypothetical protein
VHNIWQAGIKMRETALHAALDEMVAWLETSTSQVLLYLYPLSIATWRGAGA